MQGFAIGVVVMFAVACAVREPEFSTPIAWGNASLVLENVAEPSITPDPLTVRLDDDGEAWVTEFPQGVLLEQADGSVCFQVSSGDRYSGAARWTVETDQWITIVFQNSVIPLVSGPVRFERQDWNEARIYTCDDETGLWWMFVTCGDPRNGTDVRREPC